MTASDLGHYFSIFWASTQLFWSAMVGAFILYTANQYHDRQPFSFFTALTIEPNSPWIIFLDMLISSALGALAVLIILRPTTIGDAGAGGLGLSGLISGLTGSKRRRR
jgi:hypothetical protein